MGNKVYLEITNVCNLSCAFCPGTKRKAQTMTFDAFRSYAEKVAGWGEFLYFHLMGEPLLHPDLPDMIRFARALGMKPILTTNGTLLEKRGDAILDAAVHKVSISLHSFEANDGVDFDAYLDTCLAFAKKGAERGVYVVLRLWNLKGGLAARNEQVLASLRSMFGGEWEKTRGGAKLCPFVYLEWGTVFDWPDRSAADLGEECFCYGLRDQVGILVDGRVVPCCLDKDGDLLIGDLNVESLAEILSSTKAREIYDGFSAGRAKEELCRRCGFAHSRIKKRENRPLHKEK